MKPEPPKNPEPEVPVPPTILPAITSVLIILIGGLATKFKFEITQENVALLGASLATLIVAWLQYRSSVKTRDKVDRAETITPGITTVEKGMQATSTLSVNDPRNADPPVTTSNYIEKTP